MRTVPDARKFGIGLLVAVLATVGLILYLWNLDRDEFEERQADEPFLPPIAQTEVSDPVEDQEIQEEDHDDVEEDYYVKVGSSNFAVIFEDGDYENLDKVGLVRTVNNLFEHIYDFEVIEVGSPGRYFVNGREVETDLFLRKLGEGAYGPKIRASYRYIVEAEGVYHLVLSHEFIEAFIEASKYAKVTDELNEFIERLNRIRSEELNNLTASQIDSILYVDPRLGANLSIEEKREGLREFTLDVHFLNTNVFWIVESAELGRYVTGKPDQVMIAGEAIYYNREDSLPSRLSGEVEDLELSPPSDFDPSLHMEPGANEFVWVAAGTWGFIHVDEQWKLAILRPGA